MTTSLYNEALRAAEEIKYSAEEKAKQHLIEALSPQIKLMVESSLMEDEGEECGSEYQTEEEECGSEYQTEEEECGSESVEKGDSEETGKNTSKKTKAGEEKPLVGSANESFEYEMSDEAQGVFAKIINNNAKKEAISSKLSEISEGIKVLKKAAIMLESSGRKKSSAKRMNLIYKKLVSEAKNITRFDIIKTDKALLNEFYKIIKELNNMSRRRSNKSNYLNETLEDLLEMNLFEEDDDEMDLSMDAEGDESAEGDEDPLAGMADESDAGGSVSAETTVEELAQMAGLLESGEDEAPEDEGDDDDMSLESFFESDESDEGEDDEGDKHMESFFESDETDCANDEEDEMGDEGLSSDKTESYYESSRRNGDLFLEIDENMLKREISRMKRLREGEAKDMASHFGGGSLEGEMFVDGVELNKLHEMKIKAAKVVRKNRMLESKLSQYKKALRGMKGQLAEMNLFNAKLLYANKLMQNRDLSIKQQRHIVESLDEAKTLGEAKILFESLTKSLVRPANTRSGNLTESAARRPMSSSSRPVRSAQKLNESVALDRWATLAGIKK